MRQGIWKGEFEVPADWRREHKNGAVALPQPIMNGPSLTTGSLSVLLNLLSKDWSQGAPIPAMPVSK